MSKSLWRWPQVGFLTVMVLIKLFFSGEKKVLCSPINQMWGFNFYQTLWVDKNMSWGKFSGCMMCKVYFVNKTSNKVSIYLIFYFIFLIMRSDFKLLTASMVSRQDTHIKCMNEWRSKVSQETNEDTLKWHTS